MGPFALMDFQGCGGLKEEVTVVEVQVLPGLLS